MSIKIPTSAAQHLPKQIAAAADAPTRDPRGPESKVPKEIGTNPQAGPPAREGAPPTRAKDDGLFAVSLDPSQRPQLADLKSGGLTAVIDVFRQAGNALFGDMSGGKSVAELRAAARTPGALIGAGNAAPLDFVNGATSELQSAAGRAAPPADGKPGLFANPRTSQAMGDKDGASGAADGEKKSDKKEEKKDNLDKAIDTAKDVGKAIVSFLFDVAVEKFGPPGPLTTPLTGPAALDGAGGDVGAIVEGAKTVGGMQDGDYYGGRLREFGVHTPAPDGDGAPANAGEAKARGRIGALIGAMIGKFTPRLPYADKESMLGQPGGDSGPRRPGRDDLTNRRTPDPKHSPRTGNAIDPGSGDDGAQSPVVGGKGPLPKRDPGFVDPPQAFGDLFGGTPTPGGGQGQGGTPGDED